MSHAIHCYAGLEGYMLGFATHFQYYTPIFVMHLPVLYNHKCFDDVPASLSVVFLWVF